MLLQETQTDTKDVTGQQTKADDNGAVIEEYFADGKVVGAEGLHNAYHVGALQYKYEQGRDHVDNGHYYHQRKDDEFVHGLQVEPVEDTRVEVFDGLHIQLGVIDLRINFGANFFNRVHVHVLAGFLAHQSAEKREGVCLPPAFKKVLLVQKHFKAAYGILTPVI